VPSFSCDPNARTPVTLAQETDSVSDLAADSTHVYWRTSQGVRRVGKAGGTAQLFAPTSTAGALLLDETFVYYGDATGLMRLAKSGGRPEVTAAERAGLLAQSSSSLSWIVYVANDEAGPGTNVLRTMAKTGASPTTLASIPRGGQALAMDDAAAYWNEWNTPPTRGSLRSVALAGGSPVSVVPEGADEEFIRDVKVDETYVFAAIGPSSVESTKEYVIARLTKSGADRTVIARGPWVWRLALDKDFVYWSNTRGGELLKSRKDGGSTIVLATAKPSKGGWGPGLLLVAVDDTCVYWTVRDLDGVTDKTTLFRAPK
jgi:hypothetical protein